MRAKMFVTSITPNESGDEETVSFSAVCSSIGKDGLSEDNDYAKYTPSGDASFKIANPALLGTHKVGDTFYVDFTPVPVASSESSEQPDLAVEAPE